ncbi:MAG: flavin reductase family protein [Erysipelotrichaceae bacterium]|nr:flavin reductase family protein [Erysipelotrichaceae bacterium]
MEKTIEVMFRLFDKGWALVSSGTPEDFNTMTVSWGSLGTLWSTRIVTVYIKPCRYTHQFMEKNGCFTVSFFDEEYRRDLSVLGSKSGRDVDKVALTSLEPVSIGESVGFKQARATILCRKIYQHDFQLGKIPDRAIERYYQQEEPHTMYIGEVIDVIFAGEENQ